MSYNDTAHYEAEIFIESCLDAPLKPIAGTNHGKKWPRFKTNNTIAGCPMETAAEESLEASACNSQLMIALPLLCVHSVPERKAPYENSCCCHETAMRHYEKPRADRHC